MNTTVRAERPAAITTVAGSAGESLIGAGALVLAILGLIGIIPRFFLPISVIAVGVSFLFMSSAAMGRINLALSRTSESAAERGQAASGVTAELVAGVAAIVLGILALIGIATPFLSAISVLVLGAGLVLGSYMTDRLNALILSRSAERPAGTPMGIVSTAMGSSMLIGIGAVVLGILAIIGIAPYTLSLIGIIALGAYDFLSGSAVGGRLFGSMT